MRPPCAIRARKLLPEAAGPAGISEWLPEQPAAPSPNANANAPTLFQERNTGGPPQKKRAPKARLLWGAGRDFPLCAALKPMRGAGGGAGRRLAACRLSPGSCESEGEIQCGRS